VLKNHPRFRSSLKNLAILNRLKYVGEYLFGGNTAAYAEAVGFSEYWLRRILSAHTRFRVSTFMQFVESEIVSAEWLFCGTGPMLPDDTRITEISSYKPVLGIQSRHPIIDTTLLAPPVAPICSRRKVIKPSAEHLAGLKGLAQAVFLARSAHMPVILFLSVESLSPSTVPIIADLLQQRIVTSIAMSTAAAFSDILRAQKIKDSAAINSTLKLAALNGVGFAEGVGRWGFQAADDRAESILATAYNLNVPAVVLANFGDSGLYANPAIGGASFGADIGATSYVDFLVFLNLVAELEGDPAGLFIDASHTANGTTILASAVEALRRLPEPPQFQKLKRINLATTSAVNDYPAIFTAFSLACKSVYEGTHHDNHAKTITGKRASKRKRT